MPSKMRVKRLEREVKKALNCLDAQVVKLKLKGADAEMQNYYDAEDRLDTKLDEFYSEKMMYLKENDEQIFLLYLGKKKQDVKKLFLNRIKKEIQKNLDLQKIGFEMEKLKERKSQIKNKNTIKEINLMLSKLEKKQNYYER